MEFEHTKSRFPMAHHDARTSGCFGLRRQAQRDAAITRPALPKSAVAASLCQRSPKSANFFFRVFDVFRG
jgi:hypothetical protein